MANGRCSKNKDVVNTTCDGKSIVEYILCSPEVITEVIDFEVLPFCFLLSDKHNALSMILMQTTYVTRNNKIVKYVEEECTGSNEKKNSMVQ